MEPLGHDTVKGGELSFMALAMKREQSTYVSLRILAGVVPPDPESISTRLVRGCNHIALAFTACVLAVARSHRLADTVKGGELSCTALALKREKFT